MSIAFYKVRSAQPENDPLFAFKADGLAASAFSHRARRGEVDLEAAWNRRAVVTAIGYPVASFPLYERLNRSGVAPITSAV